MSVCVHVCVYTCLSAHVLCTNVSTSIHTRTQVVEIRKKLAKKGYKFN